MIVYDYAWGLYINMTNRCPNRCEFCIRDMTDSLGSADSLWLDKEPTAQEVIDELKKWDLGRYEEVVFCGYGEPTERMDALLKIARWVKEDTDLKVRINTNGLGNLINGERIEPKLEGLIDSVSVSLNHSDRDKYDALCHPRFGKEAYDGLLDFTKEVKKYVPDVQMSVVDCGDLTREDIEKCRRITEELGVKFRVR
ncbi:MAG: TIGR04100 family radical SAM protein [Clostridia bacterium]|nr:TIGR04100 family radical SAM protein [Clostridia bacterium]